jgi:hypothetical protein
MAKLLVRDDVYACCMFADTEYVVLLCSGDRAYSCITYYHPVFGPSPSFFVEKYKK